MDRGTAFGRIAFAVPDWYLPEIEPLLRLKGFQIHTPLVSLDTPGKATVQARPDCLVALCWGILAEQ